MNCRCLSRAFALAAFICAANAVNMHHCCAATTSTWDGTDGDWNSAAKWSTTPFFPDNGNGALTYDAIIGSGAVNLNINVTLASVTLNGGTLSGTANLTTGVLTLNGGALSTLGSISSDTVTLTQGTLGRSLTLPTTTDNTIQNLSISAGSTLTVPAGSTLTALTGPGEREGFGAGTLVNQGTFIKTGAGRYYASMPLNNEGLVQVQQSNLRLNNSGTHTGQFEVASDAQLELAGTQNLLSTAKVSGAGGLLIISGSTTIDSEVSANYIRLVSGTLTGTGNLHPDHFSLDAGTLDRSLTLPTTAGNTIQNLSISAGSTLTVPAGSTLTALTGPGEREGLGPGTLINEGTFVQSGSARYYASMPFNNDGLVQVQQSNLRLNNSGTHTGTFEVASGAQLELAGTQNLLSTAKVSGAGGLLIIGGTATIDSEVSANYIRLVNGTLAGTGNLHPDHFSLDAGTLARNLTLPTTTGNTIQNLAISAGSTLTVPVGSTLTTLTGPGEREGLGPGTLINEGTFVQSGSARYYASMPFNNDGLVQVQQSNLRLNTLGTHTGAFQIATDAQLELAGSQTFQSSSTVSGAGGVHIVSGTTTIDGDLSTDFLWLSDAKLAGSGTLHPNRFDFTSGSLARDLTLPVAAAHDLRSLTIEDGFTLTNPTDSTMTAYSGIVNGTGRFVNQGTITKTTAGVETLASFANAVTGLVKVQSGTLAIAASGTQDGVFEVSPGATLTFGGLAASHTTLANTSLITGSGVLRVAQGVLDARGNGTNSYSGGTTVASGGRVNIHDPGTALGTAGITIQSGGVVSIEAAGNLLPAQAHVQAGGVLAVRSDLIPQAQIAANSTGIVGIDVVAFGSSLDLSLLGNGSMSLSSTTTGEYASSTLGAGNGNVYRLGGGGGTLSLTQANVLTGNRSVSIIGPGTIVLAQSQDFSGNLSLTAGSQLILQGGLTGGGNVTLANGTTLLGSAYVAGLTTVNNGGVLSPGQSPGELAFGNGLKLNSGSHFTWELAALSTSEPAVNWDQLNLTGGALNILPGAKLDLKLIVSATAPDGNTPFWGSSQRWHIINLTGAATNPSGFVGFSIDNSSWKAFGAFHTVGSESGLAVDLVWNPVPEPASWLMMLMGCTGILWIHRRSRGSHPSP